MTRELTDFVVLLNNRCNLSCRYCSFREDQSARQIDLAPDLVTRAITFFFAHAAQSPAVPRVICFDADGEALLSRELLDDALVQAAALRGSTGATRVTIALVTNATLVDEATAARWARLGVAVTVSLDGPAAVHDAHRQRRGGAGTHAEVVRGILRLRAAGVPVSLRAVVTPETAGHLPASYETLARLQPARPPKLRPVRGLTAPYLDPGWARAFTARYLELVEQLLTRRVPLAALPDDAQHLARFVREGVPRGRYCGAGESMVWLTPTGALVPCGLMSTASTSYPRIDDVATADDLVELLDHPAFQELRARHEAPPCGDCRWLPACGGGCPMLRPSPAATPPLCQLYTGLGELLERHHASGESRDARHA